MSRYSPKSSRFIATNRPERKIEFPVNRDGQAMKVSEFFGENTWDFKNADEIPNNVRNELIEISQSTKKLSKELAEIVASAVTNWALSKGVTHFCHWFQPLTGSTAEKHDAFISLKGGQIIEHLSSTQLMQGEPDASSFPNGGSRSTFEARGYTSWDMTSPMFILDGVNGKTLCIPTAFISYTGQALDIKTPLLRSEVALGQAATKFLNLVGEAEVKSVTSTCGPEQEYFLVDKEFFYARPDLVMTGRTLLGSLSSRNQQLSDHYFGAIPDRVIEFMQEFDYELHRLGVPAKTRHNEVAPGQYEMAPIFDNTNVAADRNQIVMATLKRVAAKHNFVALIHEKPFAGVNGSGKHLNWSLASDTGINLLEPGSEPHTNARFLAFVSTVIEAIYRHGAMIRASITSAGNDHRLGANEAPPSIISVYTGDTLEKIFNAIIEGKSYNGDASDNVLDVGTRQLATLLLDNTDRNRTSPFAFTGNKFELRACGSEQSIGLPLSVLNAAVADVLNETNSLIEKETKAGKSIDDALAVVTKKWLTNAQKVIFNGDGYSDEWVQEAEKRGLPNLRTTADALPVLVDSKANSFLINQNVFTKDELETRYNVLIERYNQLREIEFNTLSMMVSQHVIPAVVNYKDKLSSIVKNQKDIGLESSVEKEIYKKLNFVAETLYSRVESLKANLKSLPEDDLKKARSMVDTLLPLSEEISSLSNQLEESIPDELWGLPKYYEMLFLR